MAETLKRICIRDYHIVDGDKELIIKRGKEYITSPEKKDKTVTVLTTYWAYGVPVEIFAGEVKFT